MEKAQWDAARLDDTVNRADIDEVIQILNQGISPNILDVVGDPILISAAWIGNPEIVQLLIQRGADVNAKGTDGKNALQRLRQSNGYWPGGHNQVIEILLHSGAKE